VLLKRFYHEGLAQASYLVGCQKTGEALVVDPLRDPLQYLSAARENGLRITRVTETHIHADYLSGTRELAHASGATMLLSAEGGSEWQYGFAAESGAHLLRDGDTFQIGNIRFDVAHTPGHTPEHLTFVVTDLPSADQPVGAFTGDFIFVGDVGRPDLLERAAKLEGTMRAGAAALFDSLQRFMARYPDHLQLWPGHGAGSACGKALGAMPFTTLGYERLANWGLRVGDRERFVEDVLAGQPDPPRYFATMKHLNKAGPRVLGAPPAPRRCDPNELWSLLQEGRRVVDIRPAAAFADGHVAGAISIPFNKSFLTWAGWFLPYDADFALVTGDDEGRDVAAAAQELALIGLDRCRGWFGPEAMGDASRGLELRTVPQWSVGELATRLATDAPQLVDVRAIDEWSAGHIGDAIHIPLGRLVERLAELTPDRPVALQCQTGGRSQIAASLLQARGYDVANVAGGIVAWNMEGRPVVGAQDAAARG
jgi:hydroxyacylglutathione hydrolase